MPTSLLTARTEFAAALNQVCAERGISPESVLESIRLAIVAAYRKDFDLIEEEKYEVEVDPQTGGAKIFQLVEDKKAKVKRKEVTPPGFGRIAAQTAKQVILQKIREAEKEAIVDEYKGKVETVISGMVLRFDGKDVICDIGRGQGRMPPEEQAKGEHYQLNKRMVFYLSDIRETMRGKQIIISRAAPQLVAGLFRREVPEVSSGAVTIKDVAREPGNRSKVAVVSNQPGVDPVGSCVGQKGVRVQAVIEELGGEKIDVIQYSDDPKKFISGALAPAENIEIVIDNKKKTAKVFIPEDQLSLAIGREGQNVRLASKLTGYKIDIQPQQTAQGKKAKSGLNKKKVIRKPKQEQESAKRKKKPKALKKS